jgi:hypothetical protein
MASLHPVRPSASLETGGRCRFAITDISFFIRKVPDFLTTVGQEPESLATDQRGLNTDFPHFYRPHLQARATYF